MRIPILLATLIILVSGPITTSAQSIFKDRSVSVSVKKGLQEQLISKLETLKLVIENIGNEKLSKANRDRFINEGDKLFIPGAIIETSSCNRSYNVRRTIREYLLHLDQLPYDHVDVEFQVDIAYINWDNMEQVKGEDDLWRGTVDITQKFVGNYESIEKTKLNYQDITSKTITVQIKRFLGRRGDEIWSVYLGDIRVDNTTNCK